MRVPFNKLRKMVKILFKERIISVLVHSLILLILLVFSFGFYVIKKVITQCHSKVTVKTHIPVYKVNQVVLFMFDCFNVLCDGVFVSNYYLEQILKEETGVVCKRCVFIGISNKRLNTRLGLNINILVLFDSIKPFNPHSVNIKTQITENMLYLSIGSFFIF